jgi:hypothetical protein
LNEYKVSALFGYIGGINLAAALEPLQQSGVPLLGAAAIPDSLRLKRRNSAYYLRAGYGKELQKIVQQLSVLRIGAVALAHISTPDGEETKQSLAERSERAGHGAVGEHQRCARRQQRPRSVRGARRGQVLGGDRVCAKRHGRQAHIRDGEAWKFSRPLLHVNRSCGVNRPGGGVTHAWNRDLSSDAVPME